MTSSKKRQLKEETTQNKETPAESANTVLSNPLKRKREAPQTENVDPKLKEFLGVMQATRKTKTWQNEVMDGVVSELPESVAIDGSSDGEMQVIESKRHKKIPNSSEKVADASPAVDDQEQKLNGHRKLQSDSDWLRSRTGDLLVDEDEQSAENPESENEHATNDAIQPEAENEDQIEQQLPINESEPPVNDEVAQILEHGRLFLRNLPFTIIEDELREKFGEYGDLEEVSSNK